MIENKDQACETSQAAGQCQQANVALGGLVGGLVEGLNACSQAETAPQKITVALNSNAAEVLRCLFFHGPTWDGNVPSKSGRDELVDMKLAQRGNGWQWLTRAGIEACFANGIHNEKDRRESRERQRRIRLEEAVRQYL